MAELFLFGVAALALSILYAARPVQRLLSLVVGFSVVTIIAGCLGAVSGVQHSVHYIGRVAADERWVFLVGLRESLNNVVVALAVVCVVSLITMVGSWRMGDAAR